MVIEKSSIPIVSVITNCFNSEKYLHEAIESVLAQTYQNWELIIWDNCSTDRTAEIAQSYIDERISYFLADYHTALGEARNLAIGKSQGQFIGFLDSDDIWLPEKLEKQLPLFSDPVVGIVICDTYFFNQKSILSQLYKKNKPPVGKVFRQLLSEYFVSLETAMIRRIALESMEYWFDTRFNVIEEYDLFVRIGYKWELAYIDQVLAKWRVHGSSWTWTRGNLFPLEKKLMLQTFEQKIPDFGMQYQKEILLVHQSCDWDEALMAWKEGDSFRARQLLNPYMHAGFKWMASYWLTYFPFSLYAFLDRLRGGARPT
jgi:glycosyltransferase involved in cell wall biosynthesis